MQLMTFPGRIHLHQANTRRPPASLAEPSRDTNVPFVLDFGIEGRAVTPLTAWARSGVHALPKMLMEKSNSRRRLVLHGDRPIDVRRRTRADHELSRGRHHV